MGGLSNYLRLKKSIIVGLSKLPSAMENAISSSIIKSAFRDNGQINELNDVIPNEKALLGTYHGVINETHYLNDSKRIIIFFKRKCF